MQNPTENQSLKPYNTFRIDVNARYLAAFTTTEELAELVEWARARGLLERSRNSGSAERRLFVLGGGSNVLFTRDIDGLVLQNRLKGVELIHEEEEHVYVRAGAGESWAGFVEYCLERGWAGVENLSLIPGCVGAAPIQNIGAYGVELQDVFLELDAWSLPDRRIRTFTLGDCAFGYRDSVFKGAYRDQYIILTVTLRLRKTPIFHVSYGAIREELERMGVHEPSIRAVSQAVITIRRSKLPDPADIGNAGSFFKNPTVTAAVYGKLRDRFAGIVGYPVVAAATENPPDHGELPPATAEPVSSGVKLAAGWLIEQCGWKGYRQGDAGVHTRQALVLVNYGNASGADIHRLSEEIKASVRDKFGVELEGEVNIV
jgi:UDP-N-acetylmuramate dehydrogenase